MFKRQFQSWEKISIPQAPFPIRDHFSQPQEAATVLRPVGTQDLRLATFVVPRSGQSCPGPENLRAYLGTALTEAAIPSIIVFVDRLPRTASGKIDRLALKAWDIDPVTARTSLPPRTQMERLVAECWEETLKVTGINLDDDFFVLGGDSLQVIHMTLRLQKLLPVQMPLSALFFQDPTLKAFANAIEIEVGDSGLVGSN